MEQSLVQARRQAMPPPDGAPTQAPPEQGGGSGLNPPDWRQFTPPEMVDAVERVLAAGAKTMYSEGMRDEVRAAIAKKEPVAQKLASNTAGLLLTLDQQAKGGIPVAALFPAGMALLAEVAEVMQAAGIQVGQEDYNDAAMLLFAILGRKMGASEDQIMAQAQKFAGGEGAAPGQEPGQAPMSDPGMPPPDDEMQGMMRGAGMTQRGAA